MLKILLMSTAVVVGATSLAAAAPMLGTGRNVSMHRHHMRMHHHHHYYGIGSFGQGHRTTATGGNPGGYSTRN